tara:strand:+ start:1048 stop:1299 length:252 start_codon:yes stop_codon:yes gene_type:complete
LLASTRYVEDTSRNDQAYRFSFFLNAVLPRSLAQWLLSLSEIFEPNYLQIDAILNVLGHFFKYPEYFWSEAFFVNAHFSKKND